MFFISTSILQRLLSYISRKGLNADDLLKKAKVEKSFLDNMDNKLPLEDYYSIMDAAIDMTGDDFFGLHMGHGAAPGDLSILGYIMASCKNIREALEKVGKYFAIIGSTQKIYLKVEGDDAKLIWEMIKEFPNKCVKHCLDSGLANTYNMILNIADGPVEIKEVWVKAVAPDDINEYKKVFDCPILFNKPAPALVFPSKVLDIPLKNPNPMLLSLLEHHANSFLSKIAENDHFSRMISLQFYESIQGNNPTIKDVARNFGMSVRVLQNKLKEEGITFSELATKVRQELAKSYLAEKHYTIDDITYLVGFSEPSVFRRAFKRWTGMTASQYRAVAEPQFRAKEAKS
jgi:AraC-like DNA-binding protein